MRSRRSAAGFAELDARRSGRPTRPTATVLDAAHPESYDHVVVMSYSDLLDEQRADGKTLVTLLHLRDIAAKTRADASRSSARCSTCATATWPGDARRRLHRQRPAGQPDDDPARREPRAQAGVRRPLRRRGLGDLPEAGRRLRPTRRAGRLLHGRRVGAPARRDRLRLPATPAWPNDSRAQLRRGAQPGQGRSRSPSAKTTRSSSWPRTRRLRLPTAEQELGRHQAFALDLDHAARLEAEAVAQPA